MSDNLGCWAKDLPKECLEKVMETLDPSDVMAAAATCMDWRRDLDLGFWNKMHLMHFGRRTLKHHNSMDSFYAQAQCRANRLHGTCMKETRWHDTHERWVTAVGISPEGSRIVSGAMDCVAKVWDRTTGAWIQHLRGHGSAVCTVSFPSEETVVSGSRDGTCKLWDLETGKCHCSLTLEGGRQWVNAVDAWPCSSPSPRLTYGGLGAHRAASSAVLVACGSSVGNLAVWDSRSAQRPAITLHGQGGIPLSSVYAVSACGGHTLAAGTASGKIYLYDLRQAEPLHEVLQSSAAVTCLAVRPGSLVAGDLEGSVCMWILPGSSGQPVGGSALLASKYQHRDWVRCLDEIDGVTVSCCRTGEIKVASLNADEVGRPELRVQASWSVADSIGHGPDGKLPGCSGQSVVNQAFGVAIDDSGIVIGCQDKSIKMYWFTNNGTALSYL